MNKKNTSNGFTFIEIIIVLAIFTIISSIVFASFSALTNKQALDKEVDNIKSIIQKTRLESLNAKNGNTHAITFASTTVVTSETSTTTTTAYSISPDIVAQDINLKIIGSGAATSTVFFAKITGMTNATGTITYVLKKGSTVLGTTTLKINALGTVE